MKKIIPVKYPVITSYPYYASALAIIQAYDGINSQEIIMNWISQNFIVASFRYYDDQNIHLNFANNFTTNSFLTADIATRIQTTRDILLTEQRDIFDFIFDMIDDGFGIYLWANEQYFSIAHRDYKFYHDTFIYGYDKEHEIFHIGNFYNGKKFSFETITFVEAKKALEISEEALYKRIFLFKNKEHIHVPCNIDNIRNAFEVHITSIDDNIEKTATGRVCYDYVIAMLNEHGYNKRLDIRMHHVLYEQKKAWYICMCHLIGMGLISNDSKLLSQIKDLENACLLARNLALKINMQRDGCERLIEIYLGIVKEDYECALHILDVLS